MADVPRFPGLYFAVDKYSDIRCPVHVYDVDGRLFAECFGHDVPYDLDDFTDWSGPFGERTGELLVEAVELLDDIVYCIETAPEPKYCIACLGTDVHKDGCRYAEARMFVRNYRQKGTER